MVEWNKANDNKTNVLWRVDVKSLGIKLMLKSLMPEKCKLQNSHADSHAQFEALGLTLSNL